MGDQQALMEMLIKQNPTLASNPAVAQMMIQQLLQQQGVTLNPTGPPAAPPSVVPSAGDTGGHFSKASSKSGAFGGAAPPPILGGGDVPGGDSWGGASGGNSWGGGGGGGGGGSGGGSGGGNSWVGGGMGGNSWSNTGGESSWSSSGGSSNSWGADNGADAGGGIAGNAWSGGKSGAGENSWCGASDGGTNRSWGSEGGSSGEVGGGTASQQALQAPAPAVGPLGGGEGAKAIDKGEEIKIEDAEGKPVELQPLKLFAECPFPPVLQAEVQKAGFITPSQIQAYSWPLAFQGRDVIGVAATGSGKTIAFLFPAFKHILEKRLPARDPVLLTLAPTRELAVQIEKEAQRFGQSSQISCVCAYGGAPKHEQLSAVRRGVHCLIATPGRLNDFLEGRQIRLGSVEKLVLDEADRMLDMGFEPQIRKILKEVPSRRQTLFFTATWPKEVRKLAEDFLYKPYKVQIGDRDELKANTDITQIVKILSSNKEQVLLSTLKEYEVDRNPSNLTLVFCGTKRMCDTLERLLQRNNMKCSAIHGDKDQRQRDEALDNFRNKRITVLVATDVAARGLDIKGVVLVINFDPANNTEDYVHRIGRTGRAGMKGTAVTFLMPNEGNKAKGIMSVMEKTGLQIPDDLRTLAASAPEKGSGKGRFREGGNREDRDGDSKGFGRRDSLGDSFGDRDRDRGGEGPGGGRGGGMPSSNPFSREENQKKIESPARRRSPSRKRGRDRSRSKRRSRSRDRRRDRSRDRSRSRRNRSRDRRDRDRSRRRKSRSRSRRRRSPSKKRRSPSTHKQRSDAKQQDDAVHQPQAGDVSGLQSALLQALDGAGAAQGPSMDEL